MPTETACICLFILTEQNRRLFDYYYQKKRKGVSFGIYPLISLAEAREKRDAARKLVVDGKDPKVERDKKLILNAYTSENTLFKAAERRFECGQNYLKPGHSKEVRKRLENDIFKDLGSLPIEDVDAPMLIKTIRKIEKRGAFTIAKRQLQKCGQIYKFAIAEGIVKHNPVIGLTDALTKKIEKTHYASIEIEDVAGFIKTFEENKNRFSPHTVNAVKLLMLTWVRTKELIEAKKEEFSLDKADRFELSTF